jgi:hypothetical protein
LKVSFLWRLRAHRGKTSSRGSPWEEIQPV